MCVLLQVMCLACVLPVRASLHQDYTIAGQLSFNIIHLYVHMPELRLALLVWT